MHNNNIHFFTQGPLSFQIIHPDFVQICRLSVKSLCIIIFTFYTRTVQNQDEYNLEAQSTLCKKGEYIIMYRLFTLRHLTKEQFERYLIMYMYYVYGRIP